MTLYIKQTERPLLDAAVTNLLDTLRQLESDETGIHDNTDERIIYVITSLLSVIYTHNPSAYNSALGVLEATKCYFYANQLQPALQQRNFDQMISEVVPE